MSYAFERFVALRYLRSKRKEVFISIITVISVIGVALSVMVLNMVLSIMTGFESELQAKLVDANAHVTIRSRTGAIENYAEILPIVRSVADVTSAYPYTLHQAMLASENGSRGLLVRGITNEEATQARIKKWFSPEISWDEMFSPPGLKLIRPDGTDDNVILPALVLGASLYDRIGAVRDVPVTLFAPQFSASPQGLLPKLKRFQVVGSYHSGMVEYENGVAYTAIDTAQKFFGVGDTATGIEVSVKELFRAGEVANLIAEQLDTVAPELLVSDWTAQNKPLWDAIKLEKQVYFLVLLLLIIIASFSIVSTLVMVVMEKGKDIAILKSIGATDRSVLVIFLSQGAIIGASGVILGTILGFLGCVALREYGFPIDAKVFSIDKVPVHMSASNFAMVAISGFFITALAGVYPALRAARLRPADALRFE